MQGNKDMSNGTAIVKTEPGNSKFRLPSLKGPRDLSLTSFSSNIVANCNASKKKTVYMPRSNVQRNKVQRQTVVTVKQEVIETKQKINASERGRGRGKREIIQSGTSVFGEGLAPTLKCSRFSRSGGAGGGETHSDKAQLLIPKLTKQENIKINKEEEDLMLKELLKDDFIDDPSLDPDYGNCPVKLPLSESNLFQLHNTDKKIKTEMTDFAAEDSNFIPGNVKIKVEPGLEDEIEGKLNEVVLGVNKCVKKEEKPIPSVSEVMNSKERQFVMLQLPSCLPGLKPEVENSSNQDRTISSQHNGPSTSNNHLSSEPSSSSLKNESEPRCTLQSLKQGKIGKMQILKSGRVRLILGDTKLWLEMGTQVSFKQDLVSVDIDKNIKSGKTICMGPIPLRMTVTPDWEHLLSSRTVT